MVSSKEGAAFSCKGGKDSSLASCKEGEELSLGELGGVSGKEKMEGAERGFSDCGRVDKEGVGMRRNDLNGGVDSGIEVGFFLGVGGDVGVVS